MLVEARQHLLDHNMGSALSALPPLIAAAAAAAAVEVVAAALAGVLELEELDERH